MSIANTIYKNIIIKFKKIWSVFPEIPKIHLIAAICFFFLFIKPDFFTTFLNFKEEIKNISLMFFGMEIVYLLNKYEYFKLKYCHSYEYVMEYMHYWQRLITLLESDHKCDNKAELVISMKNKADEYYEKFKDNMFFESKNKKWHEIWKEINDMYVNFNHIGVIHMRSKLTEEKLNDIKYKMKNLQEKLIHYFCLKGGKAYFIKLETFMNFSIGEKWIPTWYYCEWDKYFERANNN